MILVHMWCIEGRYTEDHRGFHGQFSVFLLGGQISVGQKKAKEQFWMGWYGNYALVQLEFGSYRYNLQRKLKIRVWEVRRGKYMYSGGERV